MRILIADHQTQIRKAMAMLLTRFPVFEIAAEVSGAVDLIHSTEQAAPDLILLDLNLPGLQPGKELAQIRRRHPRVIIIGMSANSNHHTESLHPELDAYITKLEPADRLLKILRKYALGLHERTGEKT